MKHRMDSSGFTLVEVIVVLVILAILAAILIPAYTGYIDRAHEKAAIAECRQVVLASQGVASELYASTKLTASILYSSHLAEVQALSEVPGTIESILIQPETAAVTFVSYLSAAGIRAEYRAGVYSISLSGASAPGISGSVSTSGLSGGTLQQNRDLLKQFAAANGGTLPALSSFEQNLLQSLQKKLNGNTKTFSDLYWRPVVYNDNGDFFLVASNDTRTDKTNVQGTMVYYNGSYYYHTNGYGVINSTTIGDSTLDDGGSVKVLSPTVLDTAGTEPPTKSGWVKVS